MIAVDTNILVYAARPKPVFDREAVNLIASLAEQADAYPLIFSPPSDLDEAIETLERSWESPSLTIIGDAPARFPRRHCATWVRLAIRS